MLVKDLKQLPSIKEVPEIIALDFETIEGTFIIKGFSFAYRNDGNVFSFYCPISHFELEYYPELHEAKNLPIKKILAYLKELVRDRVLIFHNAEFDTQVLKENKIEFNFDKIEDTMLMHYVIDTERFHGLKSIMENEYKVKVINYSEASNSDFKTFAKYADNDARYTLFLYFKLKKEIKKLPLTYKLYKNYELPFIKVLQSMNYDNNGITIDFILLSKYYELVQKEIQFCRTLLIDNLGDINFNSTKQLGQALKSVGYKILLTEKGNFSLSEEELIKIKNEQGGDIIELILYYRSLQKINSTYIEPYISNLNSVNGEYILKGYQFVHIGTRTGRLSSRNPNMQNQPREVILMRLLYIEEIKKKLKIALKKNIVSDDDLIKFKEAYSDKINLQEIENKFVIDIRKIFKAKKGYKFIGADFSQIELRMAAHCSNDQLMLEAYKNDIDIHQQTADKVCEVLKTKFFKRQQAKAVNFGILYGLYHKNLAKQTGMSLEQSKNVINTWWNVYRGVRKFVNNAHIIARKTGYATTILGRRRNVRTLGINNNEDFFQRNYAENATISHIVSGSSADLIKVAMINIYKKYKDKIEIKLQVHDELLIEVPENEVDKFKDIIKYEMENALKLRVPIKSNVSVGNNWREVH